MVTPAFLRIPPFPGHKAPALAGARQDGGDTAADGDALAAALRAWRVGGTFWGPAADLPPGRDVVLCATHPQGLAAVVQAARDAGVIDRAVLRGMRAGSRLPCLPADGDPWNLCQRATLVIADAADETALVAAISGTAVEVVGEGRFAALRDPGGLQAVLAAELAGRWTFEDPFGGGRLTALAAIALLGNWRALIEANRPVAAIYGVARWKRVTADPLLWDGTGPVRHHRAGRWRPAPPPGSLALAWMARTDAAAMAEFSRRGVRVGEIEDGMVRSSGLGANCVPPLSIVVDAAGPHFDPAQASELEGLLQTAEIDGPLIDRAARLRDTLVHAGIGKYGRDDSAAAAAGQRTVDRRLVLVTGQVEDDRSVLCGGAGLDNLALLQRARAAEPDARIIFKPHPDVEAGHRKGHVPDARALRFADEIDRTSSIAALLGRVDAVHVLTSLAGFEALMRGREVITHGVPFYAGWGLTRDLGPVPARRTRRRTLDELVAATLILYPRYVDPVTLLPCPPEVLIDRIAQGQAQVHSPFIALRELQGRIRRGLRRGRGR